MLHETITADDKTRDVQSAEIELVAGPIRLRLSARATPLGLLAFGVLLSGVVASSSAVVWAARRRAHRPPS